MSSSAPASTVRLPSISELTSRSPINDAPSQLSPRSRADSRLLPNIGGTTGGSFRYPLKQTNPSNYVLGNMSTSSSTSSIGSLSKLPSPTLPYYDNKVPSQQLPPPPAPHHQLPTPPQQPTPSATSSPTYQYYQYQQSPVMHAGPPPAQQIGYPASQPSYYHQPIYYQGNGASPVQIAHPQYAIPEVINKPTNKCHRCGTTETPEWRRGPKGVRTLCNACGLFHAKLVKRKGAALAAEEVLNNKVCKGKNGRRISIKKHLLNQSLKNTGVKTEMATYQTSSIHQIQPPNVTSQMPLSSPTGGMPLPPPVSHHIPNSNHYGSHLSNSNYPTHISMHLIRH
ncbi:uncharacterized protein RJT20DRAFT_65392 [Scheffersomyces xylosifermentans]|uniref:uncharacterized protein n=1 Tax=Scheffersomyces xylosifermentans TaxID=1304137 RepID=UPI00315D591D